MKRALYRMKADEMYKYHEEEKKDCKIRYMFLRMNTLPLL